MSLDGFIADPKGGIDWLSRERYSLKNEDFGYTEFYQSTDVLLIGRNTLEQIMEMDVEFPYKDKPVYYFGNRELTSLPENVKHVKEDSIPFVERLKGQGKGIIWLVGGGSLNGSMLRANLIDELILTIMPECLGSGISLFGGRELSRGFSAKESTHYDNGIIQLHYILEDV